jgi:hypothetical protein
VPELTVAPRSGMNIPDVHIYRATLRPEDVVLLGEARVTSMPRTLADVARHRPVAAAVAAMDAALHRELVTVEEIQDVLRFCVHWPLVPRGWRALKLADGRAESPLESISRLLFPMLGLPVPNIQQTIFDRSGRLIGRADYYWDEFGVVGEADGRTKYSDRTVLTREKERQEEFEDLGLVVARWGWEHATVRRHVLKARLEQAFSRGRARDSAGFPRLWTL